MISRASIVRVRLRTALAVPYVAVTVNGKDPETVGVPEILPDESRTRPAGRFPVSVHVAPVGFEARATLYDIPAIPAWTVVVVIVIVVGVIEAAIVMLSCFVALAEPDTALTVNVDVPAVVGVPEIVPDVLSVKPAGRLPDAIDHVADELAASTAEYDALTVPEGRLAVVIVRAAGVAPLVIVMDSSLVALFSPSVALTVKREVPAVAGVPEIVPDVLRLNPAGSVPEATDHVAPVGFDTRVALYAVPVVPEGRSVVVIASVPSA